MGRDVVRKTLHRSLFSPLLRARHKNQLSACHCWFFLFSPLPPHPPITLRLPRLAFLGRDVVGKTLHRSLSLLYFGRATKTNLVLVTGLVFYFLRYLILNHASPSEARVLGKGRRRKNAPQEPFSLLYFGAHKKTNLVLVTGLVFIFSAASSSITLRLRGSRSWEGTSSEKRSTGAFSLLYFGRATKTNLVLVTGLVFLFSPLPHPPITLRLPRLAFLDGTSSEKRSTGAFFSPLLRARHKNQLSACHWVGFYFFRCPHPPITLRLPRLAFLGWDVVGKVLLFIHSHLTFYQFLPSKEENTMELLYSLLFAVFL